ncbi:hypothetical protein PVL29_007241 [Vitis rotundifolia]|uniref:Protein RETICULATA-RELATED 4, chloroplastic-like n=1 Tax=Vitis rotundifolia TaxID=103349 RepID=A0AA39A168_VITRO|nr:hypothetical protein PVL29_007241 [Vitis rotundifolia]
MAIAASFETITAAVSGAASLPKLHVHRPSTSPTISFRTALIFSRISSRSPRRRTPAMPLFSGGGGGGINGMGNSGGGSGGDDDVGGGGGHDDKNNKKAAVMVLAEVGRSLESVPKDLAVAIESGKIPAAIVEKYLELEKSAVFRWLLQFGGFRERLLADDLFLAKVAMECGVGIFTKTAAEYERRRENFFKELDFVIADVVMAIIADFMLVWLPAPTVSLRPPLAVNAGAIAKFFHSCPENAFQVALAGTSFSFLQRIGAIVRNGSKLFAVGTTSSLVN